MNRNFKFYTAIWAVLLVLYNAVIFLIRPILPQFTVAYDARFWIAWVITIAAFGCNLFCARIAFRENNLKKIFLRVPLVRMSYTCLILMFVFGGVLMLIPNCPAWISAVVCIVIFLLQVISIIKAAWAAETIEATEEKVQARTSFIRAITVDAENLIGRAKTDNAKADCKKVYEALRYSDPMSSESLAGIESEISRSFEAFSAKIKAGEACSDLADELVNLIGDRNRKCKVMK